MAKICNADDGTVVEASTTTDRRVNALNGRVTKQVQVWVTYHNNIKNLEIKMRRYDDYRGERRECGGVEGWGDTRALCRSLGWL